MSRGINKVMLLGFLGGEPVVKLFSNGNKLVQVSLATTESWRDKNSGETKSQTQWHRVVFSHKLAEIAQEFLHKGSQIFVEGNIATRKWTNQLGQDQYTTEVKVNNFQMLSKKNTDNPSELVHLNTARMKKS